MILFLESVAGIAGDMCAASFVDAGVVDAAELQAIPGLLGLEGVQVLITQSIKATMRATHVNVTWENENWKRAFGKHPSTHTHANILNPRAGHESHWHSHYVELDRFLEQSRLAPDVRDFARTVFRYIAEAEASAHGVSLEEVAFHEVGAVDSIVDVAMVAYCVRKVAPVRVLATPIKLGRGTITIDHGTHPVPPPASARLCLGMPVAAVPDAITRPNVELSTPTGLAILKALRPEFVEGVPTGIVRAQGMGAGTMDLGVYPNVFRLMLLDESTSTRPELPYESDRIVEICCNIDDETAERTAWVMEELLARGALDVWVTPVTGKKGRAAVCLSLLAATTKRDEFADWLLRHSSTFGVRFCEWDRLKLVRRFEKRDTPQGPLTYKVGFTTDGKTIKEKPEFEELRKVWEAQTRPKLP